MGETNVNDTVGTDGWRSEVEIRQLRAFLATASSGSVSAAATSLGLAQSTVSEALSALDRALGTTTIVRRRGARHTMLTDAGSALLPHARRVLQTIDSVHRDIATVTHGANASITITANESVSTYLLAPTLGDLRGGWPNIRFSVAVATCPAVRADVADGRCDLGLLLEDHVAAKSRPSVARATRTHGGAERIVLASEVPLVIFSGAKHTLARRDRRHTLTPDAIAAFPMFVADAAGEFHDLIQRYLAADGLPGPRLEPVGSIDAVKRAVHGDNSALGILPRYAIADDMESGKACALGLHPAPPHLRLVALLPATRSNRHPAVTQLLRALRSAR